MSLDVYLKENEYGSVYHSNITHNLGHMAAEAGIYEACWRPYRLKPGYNIPEAAYELEWEFEQDSVTLAKDIIPLLEHGLEDLKQRPEYFKQFDSPNGWGLYEHFVPFVEEYLDACKKYPNAVVEVSR